LGTTGGRPTFFLIVEDDFGVLHSMQQLLCQLPSVRVLTAGGFVSATAQIAKGQIGLLVVDVCLDEPGIGVDLAFFALEYHPRLALVIISADGKCECGAFPERACFLPKPFGMRELLRAIDQAFLSVNKA